MIINIKDRILKMSLPADCSIRQALQAIDKGALGMALLVDPDSNIFQGLITDGDIRRALIQGFGLESHVKEITRPIAKTASEGMSFEQITTMFTDPVRVVPVLDKAGVVIDLAIFDRRINLPVAEPCFNENELLYVSDCVITGWVSSAGKYVTRFESMFAEYCSTKYAITTSNGTTALHLALLALGIGPGDEVIVPSLTFISTANAVTYTGAKPIFVDSEEQSWTIDPTGIESAITSKTRAIIPVHIYGHPADMGKIMDIAHRKHLYVIEDAAEAHGAYYHDQMVGGIGDIGIFSFYGNKIITTGEGGMITTNDPSIAEKVRILRDHGMTAERRYWHPVLGYNYRLTNIQAALGVAQMEKIASILKNKKQIAKKYTEMLQEISGLTIQNTATWADPVYWLFSIQIDPTLFGYSRDELIQYLKEKGIETRPLFPPVHTQPIYNTGQHLTIAEKLSTQGLSLPSSPNLKEDDIIRITQEIRKLNKT